VKEFVVYTAARLGLFLGAYAVVLGVYWLVAGGGPVPVLWPLLVAAVVSTVAAAYLLRDLRARFAARVQERAERMTRRFEEARAKEDLD
jgi:hypothetical protein